MGQPQKFEQHIAPSVQLQTALHEAANSNAATVKHHHQEAIVDEELKMEVDALSQSELQLSQTVDVSERRAHHE